MSRRRALAAYILVALLGLIACTSPVDDPSDAVVATESGKVRGTGGDRVHQFRGIPYAAAPIGEKRWAAPQPATDWTGVRDATNSGPACMQPEAPDMPSGVPQSEDCLTLDVTVPAGPGKNRPVLVWLPGGGFITGAGSIYDPTRLAQSGDVVVVTVNYRLGVYGFFSHPALGDSNFGLQDQVAALRWVRANIAHFGGDPNLVTLAGASAGAMSACTLMTAPEARNLSTARSFRAVHAEPTIRPGLSGKVSAQSRPGSRSPPSRAPARLWPSSCPAPTSRACVRYPPRRCFPTPPCFRLSRTERRSSQ
ncbi:carboxylesterase family protein [Nocardia vermiculata]|uniref:Carboxylic ester hydrolase n=1 Tax=Nocardia vermiculata TaxID=257274 RepID=A0A846Y1A4_9NOCA|nr:carboxylesterase family protein [Nocardia vermiculata]